MTGTPGSELVFINEAFYADSITPSQMDRVLANGWRHFGTRFFRYSLNLYNSEIVRVTPLRIRLDHFQLSKSQRRILRRNSDLIVENRPIDITPDAERLFDRHKQRFKLDVPTNIFEFLSDDPAAVPVEAREMAVYKENRLIATSYFSFGSTATSGIYAIFDPNQSKRSLGIFTMLKEIEYSVETGRDFYYQGYAYEGESFYDYKKRFSGTEEFDWKGNWSKAV